MGSKQNIGDIIHGPNFAVQNQPFISFFKDLIMLQKPIKKSRPATLSEASMADLEFKMGLSVASTRGFQLTYILSV